jgi:hypothetical protein
MCTNSPRKTAHLTHAPSCHRATDSLFICNKKNNLALCALTYVMAVLLLPIEDLTEKNPDKFTPHSQLWLSECESTSILGEFLDAFRILTPNTLISGSVTFNLICVIPSYWFSYYTLKMTKQKNKKQILHVEHDFVTMKKTCHVRITWHRGAFAQLPLLWKSNKYHIIWACICIVRYPACNAHSPCHLWPVRLSHTFPCYPTHGKIWGEKSYKHKMCFFLLHNFSLKHFSFYKPISEILLQIYTGIHVKYKLF